MGEWIKLLTAVFGLITAVVVYNKTKTRQIVDKRIVSMGDDFKGLKTTVNVVGTISLIMILFFGFMLLMAAFPRMFSFALGIDNEKEAKQNNIVTVEENINTNFNGNISNNQLAFEAIKLIGSSTKRDAQFIILIEKSLLTEENELTVNIIKNISSSNTRSKAIDIAFDYYAKMKKYNLVTEIIQYYDSSTKREEKVIILLEEIYKNKIELPEKNLSIHEEIKETDF